jgi:uncharacterized protein (TIGR03435 family)
VVTPLLAFEVAAIHQDNTSADGHHHIYNDPGQSHFRTINVSLKELLQFAYDIPKSQIFGGPRWFDSATFDIDAKADASVDKQLQALRPDQARHQKQLMVQTLLADRFQLTVHQETRQLPVYSLVVAKGGPKFKPSEANGTTIDTGRSRIHVQGSDNTIALLTRELAQSLGRVVLDNTGIDGRYDLRLWWTPDDSPPPMLNGAPDPNAPPEMFAAIQEQLGLKLESTKGQVPVIVVDHAAMPSVN